jgi:hypothetical protein
MSINYLYYAVSSYGIAFNGKGFILLNSGITTQCVVLQLVNLVDCLGRHPP